MRGADLTQNLDLLVKHRVSVIRGRLDQRARHAGALQPQSIRFGVWHAPVSRVLPRGSWALMSSSWMWRKTIQRMCQQFGYMHLAVDVGALTPNDLKDLQYALRAAARMQTEGSLQVHTIQQLSQRLIRKRIRPPTHSILRTA